MAIGETARNVQDQITTWERKKNQLEARYAQIEAELEEKRLDIQARLTAVERQKERELEQIGNTIEALETKKRQLERSAR